MTSYSMTKNQVIKLKALSAQNSSKRRKQAIMMKLYFSTLAFFAEAFLIEMEIRFSAHRLQFSLRPQDIAWRLCSDCGKNNKKAKEVEQRRRRSSNLVTYPLVVEGGLNVIAKQFSWYGNQERKTKKLRVLATYGLKARKVFALILGTLFTADFFLFLSFILFDYKGVCQVPWARSWPRLLLKLRKSSISSLEMMIINTQRYTLDYLITVHPLHNQKE